MLLANQVGCIQTVYRNQVGTIGFFFSLLLERVRCVVVRRTNGVRIVLVIAAFWFGVVIGGTIEFEAAVTMVAVVPIITTRRSNQWILVLGCKPKETSLTRFIIIISIISRTWLDLT